MELPVSSAWMGLRGWAMVCCVVVMMANLYLLYQRPDVFSTFTTTTITTTPLHAATDRPNLMGSDEDSSSASSSSSPSPSSSPSSSPSPSPSPSSSSSPSPVPSPQPERKRFTEVECREQGSFCIYTNLCYDGEQFVMLADDSEAILSNTLPENLQSSKTYGSTKTWFDVEAIMYDDLDALFPRNQRLTGRTMPASKLFGSDAVELPLQVDTPIERSNETDDKIEYIWLDGSVYIQSSDMKAHSCFNPWHWSLGTIPLWSDQVLNKTVADVRQHSVVYDSTGRLVQRTKKKESDMLLPSMDYVMSLCGKDPTPWSRGLLESVVPDHTRILRLDNLALVNPEVTPDDKQPLSPQVPPYEGLQPAVEGRGTLGLAPNRRMICTDKAVVHTNQFTLFNNMLEWRTFRKRVLSKLGLHQEASRLYAPPKVVFKSTGRAVNNMKELLEVCRKYTTCEMTSEWGWYTPFLIQVEEVAKAGILVGAHGAGITNAMFLPPYGALIELFPYKWWPDMYRRMANEMGIAYYMVASYDKPNTIDDQDPCNNVTALTFPYDRCTHKVKYEPFSIPVDAFEVALVSALQQIGVNAILPSTPQTPQVPAA